MLKKKKLFVSKHNIFTRSSVTSSISRISSKKLAKKTTSIEQKALNDAKATIKTRFSDPLLQLTSLDFLMDDENTVDEENDDSIVHKSAADSDGSEEDEQDEMTDEGIKHTTGARQRGIGEDKSPRFDSVINQKPNVSREHSINTKLQIKEFGNRHSFRHSPSKRQGYIPVVRDGDRSPANSTAPSSVLNGEDTTSYFNKEVMDLLRGLQSELKYYEELSGRRSVFDPAV